MIITDSGLECTIEKMLGSGSQGEVYRAYLRGKPVALKWYYQETVQETQYYNLQGLIKKGSPNEKFLWPMDLCSSPDASGFGYIMPLREERFKSIIDWMYRRVNPSFDSLLTAGFHLANSFFDLHAMGMCYRDINLGNIFFDPKNGDIAICDNDNVAIDTGEGSMVLGTPDFMAPEIIRREVQPSTDTDLYSLSVLLFYMFFINHPLYGSRLLNIHSLDTAAKNKLCGYEPLFIFDPVDKSNKAVPLTEDPLGEAGANAIEFWSIYPQFFKDLFTQSFTEGLWNPHRRVKETIWRANMIKLRDYIVQCPGCKVENFYEPRAIRLVDNKAVQNCWYCKAEMKIPARIMLVNPNRSSRNIRILDRQVKLYPHHLDDHRAYDFSAPMAEVISHPANPDTLGLKNLSGDSWIASTSDGDKKTIEPGRVLPLITGIKINFGRMDGEIKT